MMFIPHFCPATSGHRFVQPRLLSGNILRPSNLIHLKEINPEYSLEGLMLKLKIHYFGHLMCRDDSLEETLLLGKIENRTKRG